MRFRVLGVALAASLVSVVALAACASAPNTRVAPSPTFASTVAPLPTAAPTIAATAAPSPMPTPGPDLLSGVQGPLTGDYAEYGRRWKQGMEMALEEINRQGIVPGRTVKLQWEDSQADSLRSAVISKKLAGDARIVAVIGDFSSSAALAAVPAYLASRKVLLSPTVSDPRFTGSGDLMFGMTGSMQGEGPYVAGYAVNELGKKSIAVLFINNDWGSVAKTIFVESARKAGASIVGEQGYPADARDFGSILTKARSSKPELLFIAGTYSDVALIQNQRAVMGWDVPTISPESAYSPELLSLGGKAVEGQIVTATFFPGDRNPRVQRFIEGFTSLYKQEPNRYAAVAYDTLWLLAATIGRTGTDSAKIQKGLVDYASGYVGVTGPGKFGPDRIATKSYVPLQVRDGQFRLAAQK